MRDSFVFYRSFQDAINEASEAEQLFIYRAIANYALDRVEPKLIGIAKLAWVLIKPQLEANWKRYEAGVQHGKKGAEHGKKGGRPKKENPLPCLAKTLSKPSNVNVNVNVNDNVNVFNDNINESSKEDIGGKPKRFIPPTPQEIQNYCLERKNRVDANYFFDWYQSKNWMVGKNKMKDWKACVRTWEKSEKTKSSDIGVILRDNSPDKYNEKPW